MLKLAARHLHSNRRRTIMTIVGIAISVAMVTTISGFIVSFQDLLYRDSIARDGLWHVRYWGMDEAVMEQIASEPVIASYEIRQGEEELQLQLVFEKVDRKLFDRSEEICFKYGIGRDQVQYHNNLLIAKGILPGGYYESLYSFAAVLLSLVAVASVMVIRNAFAISTAERRRQFGLLKSVGATSSQIRAAVVAEGAILALVAIPVGFLLGVLVEAVALAIANYILGQIEAVTFLVAFRVRLSLWALLAGSAMALVTVLLAAWGPARKAGKISAIEAIRQTGAIRIRSRDVRILPITGKIFGFEGALAAKTMRRNRGRYRTTVVSLVVSIVLFIGVSSFGQMLFKASSMVYEENGSNVFLQLFGEDKERQTQLAEELSAWEGVELSSYRVTQGTVTVEPEQMTETGLTMLESGEKNAFLYSLSSEKFTELCRSLGLDEGDMGDPENPAGILVNDSGTYIRGGRRHNFTPYRIGRGEQLQVVLEGQPHTISVTGEVEPIPSAIALMFSANGVNLIVPESVRDALSPASESDILSVSVMARDADAFEVKAEQFLSENIGPDQYRIYNYEAMAANNRNIWMLIMIFVYGFIGLLSLISITNVITTISTGIALRKREFAMLRSLGMTRQSIAKSLRYESLIYGAKSLVYGIPLGLLASYAMYAALDGSMSFAYIWPVQSIAICAVMVLVWVAVAMWFSQRRHTKDNIVAALQDEIV